MNTKCCEFVFALTVALIASQSSLAQEGPHWNKSGCQECHAGVAPVEGAAELKAVGSAEALCESCHGGRGGAKLCRHSSNLPADGRVGDDFQPFLRDGKLACSTCHDIVYQCKRPKAYERFDNPGFLRDRDVLAASAYCMKCHDEKPVQKMNPHTGVAGSPPRGTCLLCHEDIPAAVNGQLKVTFNMRDDMNATCNGCHNVRPHPRSAFKPMPLNEWVHLVSPSAEILANMRKSLAETGIELPLNPLNGEVFCATCHNPHEFKLGGSHGSQVGTVHRLRLNDICQACHDK